jgi:hypothetical protein
MEPNNNGAPRYLLQAFAPLARTAQAFPANLWPKRLAR